MTLTGQTLTLTLSAQDTVLVAKAILVFTAPTVEALILSLLRERGQTAELEEWQQLKQGYDELTQEEKEQVLEIITKEV